MAFHVQILESLDNDGGGRDGEHTAEEDAVHVLPADDFAYGKPHGEHYHQLGNGRYRTRGTHHFQPFETELQTQGKEQEHHTYLAPHVDVGHIGDTRKKVERRTDKETGHYVAENYRLSEPFENYCGETGRYKYQREVGEQRGQRFHIFLHVIINATIVTINSNADCGEKLCAELDFYCGIG